MAPEKGEQYRGAFASSSWLRYVMSREAEYLGDILDNHCIQRRSYLDFACGTARILRLLGSHFDAPLGIDVSPSMLAVARKQCDHDIIEGDLTQDESILGCRRFDLITAFRFFPNAQPELRRDAIAALARHLSEEGILVFNNHQNRTSTLLLANRVLRRSVAWTPMGDDEAVELVQSVGLRVVRTYEIGVLPGTDRRLVVPPQLHSIADRLATRLRVSRRLAQNVIYVCRRR